MAFRNLASRWLSAKWASEQQNPWLGLVSLVVDPAARLLHANAAPLLFKEQAPAGHATVDGLGQKHVPVLILIVLVLLRVLNLVWKVRHFS